MDAFFETSAKATVHYFARQTHNTYTLGQGEGVHRPPGLYPVPFPRRHAHAAGLQALRRCREGRHACVGLPRAFDRGAAGADVRDRSAGAVSSP